MILTNFLGLFAASRNYFSMVRLAAGRLSRDELELVPFTEQPHAVAASRIHLAVHGSVWALALATGSWLPVVLIGLPRFYGIWLSLVVGVPQHLGLDEDVLGRRPSLRTILMGPVLRFFHSNMNCHMEHHTCPMVPWDRLPDLHRAVAHDCPPP